MNAKRIFALIGVVLGLAVPISVQAAAALRVTPLTWNIIGLDSNTPASGPNLFPVGARVCNTGDAASGNVRAVLACDSLNAGIYLRAILGAGK